MGVASRFISGSLASWAKILVTVGVQVALVPVYLSHWSVETYGCWLVIQAITSFVNIFSLAHHNYVGNLIFQVPEKNPATIGKLLSAALAFSCALGLFELLLLLCATSLDFLINMFDPQSRLATGLLQEALVALLVVASTTFVSVFTTGLYSRVASVYGHFPRTAWWGVAMSLAAAVGAVLLVANGTGLLGTVIYTSLLNLGLSALYQWDLYRLVRAHDIQLMVPQWHVGWTNLCASAQLGVSYCLGLFRQQGLRVVISSTLGVSQAVTFATMRTASNVAQQAVATVVEPLFPEFMGFLRDRRQDAVTGTLAFVWLAVVFAMGPLLVLLQALAPWLFELWTRGKLLFDPLVFGIFSVNMLLFGLARPADSVVFGNNLLKTQLLVASFLATCTLLGIYALDGWMGLRGVAFVLLATELISAGVLVYAASQWLKAHALNWPKKLFFAALVETIFSVIAILGIALLPGAMYLWLSMVFLATLGCFLVFFKALPTAQKSWMLQKMPFQTPCFKRG